MATLSSEEALQLARVYVEHLEQGREQEAAEVLSRLKVSDAELFQGVGRLAREVHETINEINGALNDPRLSEITQHELPDAQQRLGHVVVMTEQAANTTLSAVESSEPLLNEMLSRNAELAAAWRRFRARELQVEDFRLLSNELEAFFVQLASQGGVVQGHLSDILMAQSYQDLTGQILRKVSSLVQDVELKLVELVRIAGKVPVSADWDGGSAVSMPDDGPVVPGVNDQGRVSGQDEVDDLLSQLGF
jgi:chemotaxis protein CheZ